MAPEKRKIAEKKYSLENSVSQVKINENLL